MSLFFKLSGTSSTLQSTIFPPIQLKGNCKIGMQYFLTENFIYNITEENNHLEVNLKREDHVDFEKYFFRLDEGIYEFKNFKIALKEKLKLVTTYLFQTHHSHEDQTKIKDEIKDFNKKIDGMTYDYDPVTYKLLFKSHERIELVFPEEHSPAELMGIPQKLLPLTFWRTSDPGVFPHLGAINMTPVLSYNIFCNLTSNSYINGKLSHLLYSVPITVSPGYKVYDAPKDVIYLPITEPIIDKIELTITDQDGKLIDFRGHNVTIVLGIKFE